MFLQDMILSVTPKTTVQEIKEILYAEHRVSTCLQKIVFAGRILRDPVPIIAYGIQNGSIIHLCVGYQTSGRKIDDYLKSNKVEEIIMSADSFINLLDDSLKWYPFPLPQGILNVICDYGRTFGAQRNYIQKWTPLHDAVENNDIDKVDELLKTGMYFVDQYSSVNYCIPETPLVRAVTQKCNVQMVELLLLNGARRGIRSLIQHLEQSMKRNQSVKEENEMELLDILRLYIDEDPLSK